MDYLVQLINSLIGSNQSALAFAIAIGVIAMVLLLALGSVLIGLSDPLRRRLQAMALLGTPEVDRDLLSGVQQSKAELQAQQSSAMSLQLVLVIALPVLVFVVANLFTSFPPKHVLFVAIFAAAVGFLVPPIIRDARENRRKMELAVGFPESLDLLVACTEAGMGLNAAFLRVAEQMVYSHPGIAHQYNLLNYEIRGGVDRFQALRNFAERTDLDSVRSLVSILSQSMRYGTSIAETLRVFAEDLRDRRMQAAEEEAGKIGTKMIFPLVTCLFPSFFIIAIGPAVIGAVRILTK